MTGARQQKLNAMIEVVGQEEPQAEHLQPDEEQSCALSLGQDEQHSERVEEQQRVEPVQDNNDDGDDQINNEDGVPVFAIQRIDTNVPRLLPPS